MRQLLLLALVSCPAWGAMSFVQSKVASSSFGGTNTNITFSSSVTAGDSILVCAYWTSSSGTATISTITDSKSNTYTVDASSLSHRGATDYNDIATECGYLASVGTGGTSFTVTVTLTAGASLIFTAVEATAGAYDSESVGNGTGTAQSAGTVSGTTGGFGLTAFIEDNGSGSNNDYTVGSGWTSADNTGGGNASRLAEYQASSGSSLTGNATAASNSHAWAASMLVFTPSGGGGGATYQFPPRVM